MYIVPLVYQTVPLSPTMPYKQVGINLSSPLLTIYIPNRFWNDNYYDTSVSSIRVSFNLIHNTSSPSKVLSIGDSITLATALPPTATTELLVLNSTNLALYRRVGSGWELVEANLVSQPEAILEERLLPSCLTVNTSLYFELDLDSRANGRVLEGQALVTGVKQLFIPLVGLSTNQYASLDLTSLNLPVIDRVFITDNYLYWNLPNSSQGRYLAIHVSYSGGPVARVHYGSNYEDESELLPLTSPTLVAYSVPASESYPIAPIALTVVGGITELDQQTGQLINLTPSKADGAIRVKWQMTKLGVGDEHSYMAVTLLPDAPNATNSLFPNCPTSPQALHLVINLTTRDIKLYQGLIERSLGSYPHPPASLDGDWEWVISPYQTGCFISLFRDDNLVLVSNALSFNYQAAYRPLQLGWYLNSHVGMGLTVTPQPVNNVPPLQRVWDMCTAVSPLGLSPCLSNSELLALIPHTAAYTFETDPVGNIAPNTILTPLGGGTSGLVSVSWVPSSINYPAIISDSSRSLKLGDGSDFKISFTGSGQANKCSVRAFLLLESITYAEILSVWATSIGGAEHRIALSSGSDSPGEWHWRLLYRYRANVNEVWQNEAIDLPTSIVTDTVYALSMSVTQAAVNVYINGIRHTFVPEWTTRIFEVSTNVNACSILIAPLTTGLVDNVICAINEEWTQAQHVALANDPLTRGTYDCSQVNLTSDLTAIPVEQPLTSAGFGGAITHVESRGMAIRANRLVMIYQLPSHIESGLIDLVLSSTYLSDVAVLYGNSSTKLYTQVVVDGQAVVRGIRLSRGMAIYVKSNTAVTVRTSAALI